MKRICCYCRANMGEKEGEGVTHGICEDCVEQENEAIALSIRKRATRIDAKRETNLKEDGCIS